MRKISDEWIKRLYVCYIKNLQEAIETKDIIQIGLDFNALKGYVSSLVVAEKIRSR
jgi:hypothetical protein